VCCGPFCDDSDVEVELYQDSVYNDNIYILGAQLGTFSGFPDMHTVIYYIKY